MSAHETMQTTPEEYGYVKPIVCGAVSLHLFDVMSTSTHLPEKTNEASTVMLAEQSNFNEPFSAIIESSLAITKEKEPTFWYGPKYFSIQGKILFELPDSAANRTSPGADLDALLDKLEGTVRYGTDDSLKRCEDSLAVFCNDGNFIKVTIAKTNATAGFTIEREVRRDESDFSHHRAITETATLFAYIHDFIARIEIPQDKSINLFVGTPSKSVVSDTELEVITQIANLPEGSTRPAIAAEINGAILAELEKDFPKGLLRNLVRHLIADKIRFYGITGQMEAVTHYELESSLKHGSLSEYDTKKSVT